MTPYKAAKHVLNRKKIIVNYIKKSTLQIIRELFTNIFLIKIILLN